MQTQTRSTRHTSHIGTASPRANFGTSTPSHNWARGILENCRASYIDINHPDAIRAAGILGFDRAVRIFTAPKRDAMFHRVQGCFGSGRKR